MSKLGLFGVLVVGFAGLARAEEVAERVVLYADGVAEGYRVSAWSMRQEERTDAGGQGKFLWVNGDCQAQPWAGVRVIANRDDRELTMDAEWLAKGFLRFQMTVGYDQYGNPGSVEVQLRPEAQGIDFQALRSNRIDRGRGLDEDPESWQTVLVPLSYWTELKAGTVVRGVSLQNRGQADRPIGYNHVEFVRFQAIPEWLRQQDGEGVAQPEVEWPAYAELPPSLRGEQSLPRVQNGAFVDGQGRRTFLLAPYCREDQRLDVWGTTDEVRRAELPHHGLFDPARHGWIYQDLFTGESLRRLGFNVYSATMPAQAFWDTVGYKRVRREEDPARLASTHQRIGAPFFVDTVCWPWTIGAPGTDRERSPLPPEALTEGQHHWVPYRISGAGREIWLSIWRLYAERYRDAGVPVVGFELFNEPAYLGRSADHQGEFARWLEARYGSIAELNRVWGTELAEWTAAADVSEDPKLRAITGRFFDYDDYLSERFVELVRAGVAEVDRILPGTPTGVQTMGGYVLNPREAVFVHRFIRHQTLVLTPTGGGRWTVGVSASRQPANRLASPLAAAPLENDLLLALAGDKMVFDNETYLQGQTRREIRNRLWSHVLCGLDGLTVFSWSKRGWSWWRDRQEVQTEADKYPYSNLNPIARRTDGLRGILDFAEEIQEVAGQMLPKGWGPTPSVGLLYSWPQARRLVLDATTPDKTAAYYAALKYGHANLRVVPSDRAMEPDGLAGLKVLVLGRVRYLEPELAPVLDAFVQNGGVLVFGESVPAWDIHGQPLPTLRGCEEMGLAPSSDRENPAKPMVAKVPVPISSQPLPVAGEFGEPDLTPSRCGELELRRGVRRMEAVPGAQVLLRDAAGRPVLVRRDVGRGRVYFQAADVVGYSLLELIEEIFRDIQPEPGWHLAAEVQLAEQEEPAPNVLISRRSYADRHVLLVQNRDGYTKRLRLRLPGIGADWLPYDGLARRKLPVAADGSVSLTLGEGDPAVVIWQRDERR
jgi:hypothetical protein